MGSNTSRLTAADFLPIGTIVSPLPVDNDRRVRILHAVKASSDGITTAEVAKLIGVTGPTALRVLRELEREREVYSRAHGPRQVFIWYPNGRLVHPYLELFREVRGTTYRASIQEGRGGPRLQLQERSFSLLSGSRIEGAIFMDVAAVDEMIELLADIKMRFDSFEQPLGLTGPTEEAK